MDTTYCVIIVRIEDQQAARDLTQQDWFVAIASSDGQNPASHTYINGPIPNDYVDALRNASFEKWLRTCEWQEALAELGLQNIPIVEETVNAGV